MQVEWKRSDGLKRDPARTVLVYRSGDEEPHLWKTGPGDYGPMVAGYDWYAEFSFNLPT